LPSAPDALEDVEEAKVAHSGEDFEDTPANDVLSFDLLDLLACLVDVDDVIVFAVIDGLVDDDSVAHVVDDQTAAVLLVKTLLGS
jgi:hypothetical protein